MYEMAIIILVVHTVKGDIFLCEKVVSGIKTVYFSVLRVN